MLKRLFIITAALLLGYGLHAQTFETSNDTTKGANGAMTIILGKATAGYPEFLTMDGRYMSGVYSGAAGYVYDFEKDTCIIFVEYTLAGYFSETHYVGQDDPSDTYSNSFVIYDGVKHELEKILNDTEKPSWNEMNVWGVSDHGEKILTMGYEEWWTSAGNKNHYNRALVHDGHTGKLIAKLPWPWAPEEILVEEDRLGFGSRADCISADGCIIGGHSTNPKANSNWTLAIWDMSDPNDIKAIGLGSKFGYNDKTFGFGSFYGVSSDGTLLAGASETSGYGVIVHYDRAKKDISKIDTISPLPSWDFLAFTDIADNGMAIGYCGMSLDPGTREPIIYTPLTGVVKMTDYLYEYYDIDVRKGVDLYTPMLISRDGKRLLGFNSEYIPVPYRHELSDDQILPRARNISARAARGVKEVSITWQKPLISLHEVTGYNIYRDDETTPLNTTLLTGTTYTDNTVEAGKHTYYVEAVYGSDGNAMKQVSNTTQVVEPGAAFPVQALNHRVDYNRFAYVYWGVPSSEVIALAKNNIAPKDLKVKGQLERPVETPEMREKETAPSNALRAKSYISTTLDYIANVDMLSYAAAAGIKIGDEYYFTEQTGGGIKVYDRFNEPVKTIRPNGLGIVLSMVNVDNYLFCGTSKDIKVLDLSDESRGIVKQFTFPANHLSYVPDIKDGKPGLIAGGRFNCNAYVWDEEKDDFVLLQENFLDFGSLWAKGSAYYDGKLYVGSATGPYYNEVYVYDVATRTQEGEPIQVVEDPAMYDLLTLGGNAQLTASMSTLCQPGSLSVCELEDGTTALGMVFQCAYMTGRFMLLELESNETVAGYDLYCSVNGATPAKVNDKPMKSRRYTKTIEQAGQYVYHVIVLSENNKPNSDPSPLDTLDITDQGECPAADLSVKESNRRAVLSWMPGSSDQSLVGFDLYRDGQHIERFWLENLALEYIDNAATELGKPYTYRIETLYQEGCVSEREASITLTGEGVAQAPFGLTYTRKVNNDKKTYNVTTSWETPMFEEPLSLKYCNGLQGEAIGFDNFFLCSGLIGWDSNDLKLYKDLYLVGMEYMVGATPDQYDAIVYIDDEQVFKQSVKQFAPREWRTVWFDQSFSMNQKQEVAVGFYTRFSAESMGVLAVDPTVTVNGKSNLISLDNGDNWSTLQAGGIAGSWLLGGLVVHKRDLEAAKNADGTINHDKLAGSIMRMALNEPLNAKKADLPNATFAIKPSAKAPLQLTGFNIYRQDANSDDPEVKLNDNLLTVFEWNDATVAPGDYDYSVTAVYADGTEKRASVFIQLNKLANEDAEALELNVYPNPATEWINVEGEYESLQIFDFGGRLLRTVPAAGQIQIGDLTPGTYMLHFKGADARMAIYKIVVR